MRKSELELSHLKEYQSDPVSSYSFHLTSGSLLNFETSVSNVYGKFGEVHPTVK